MYLTYSHQKEEDAEHVENGQQRHRQRGDDLAKRRHPSEKPQDAKGAEDADDACVLCRDEKGNDRHDHDKSINLAPDVSYKRPKPMSKSVDRELDSENRGEQEIQIVKEISRKGRRAVLMCEQRDIF